MADYSPPAPESGRWGKERQPNNGFPARTNTVRATPAPTKHLCSQSIPESREYAVACWNLNPTEFGRICS